jgi:hypothetical protein
MFYLWRRMGEENQRRVWRLYGWFSGLMACGSCVGAVAWGARMMRLVNLFEANASKQEVREMSLGALSYSWESAFLVTYAIAFLCLSAAKLMVLDRLSVFAAPQGTLLQKRWAAAGRILMAAVVLGNAVGLVVNATAAVHFQKAAHAASTSSAAYAANNTKDGISFRLLSQEEVQRGGSILSVQSFCEVVVLLLIVVAFVVVGVLSARRVRARLLEVDAASATAETVRAVRVQILATTTFVFVAFVLRAAFSIMNAVALQFRDLSCTDLCGECNNVFTNIADWMTFTPEFQMTIVLVSSPLALLVVLWGMTSKTTLHLMVSSEQEISLNPL